MSEIHLIQPGFTYRACRPITKNKERIQKFKDRGDLRFIYQNELDLLFCFYYVSIFLKIYGDFKD